MTITQSITPLPTPPDPTTDDEVTFSEKASAYTQAQVTHAVELEAFRQQINAESSSLNTLSSTMSAATGSMWANYTFLAGTTEIDPGAGYLRLNASTLGGATKLYLSEIDSQGVSKAALIAIWDDAPQVEKGLLRIVKASDTTVYGEYTVSGTITDNGTWDTLTLTPVGSSGALANGDAVIVTFQRHGADGADAEFTSPTRTIAASAAVTSADNGYLLDVTAAGVTLTLDSAAALGAGWSCLLLESANTVTISGAFNDGATSKQLRGGCAYMLSSTGTAHRVVFLGAIVLDRAYAEYTTNADLTAVIPFDDSIPQVSEGTQILSVSLTPKSTSSRLRVRVQCAGTLSNAGDVIGLAVFINGATNATGATFGAAVASGGAQTNACLEFEYVPGSTSAQTLTVRTGPTIGTLRLNGIATGRRYGGTARSTIVVEEIAA